MKRVSFLFLIALLPLYAWSYKTTVDGVTYSYADYQNAAYVGSESDFYKICQITGIEGNVPERFIIPDSIDGFIVASIIDYGEGKFGDIATVKHIELPLFCREVWGNVFSNCPNLESVVLESHLEYVSLTAFDGCDKLRSITCYAIAPPQKLWYWRYDVNEMCSVWDDNIRIQFSNEICSKATLYVRPNCKSSYKESVFGKLSKIEEMDVAEYRDGDERKGGVDGVQYTYTILSVTDKTCLFGRKVPNSAIRMPSEWDAMEKRNDPDWLAVDISTSGTVNIPKEIDGFTITELGYGCLYYDKEAYVSTPKISGLIIPQTVQKIWGYLCSGSYLKSVISGIEQPFGTANVLDESTLAKVTLYVPDGKSSLYNSASGWKEFKNIKEMSELPTNIKDVTMENDGSTPISIYAPDGIRLNSPAGGLMIIQMNNGDVRKVVVQ